MGRRYCIVPGCGSTSTKMPDKRFIAVPKNVDRRNAWLEAAKTEVSYSTKATLYCCEDHFNFEEDCANWIQQQYYEYVRGRIILKPDVVPHIFNGGDRTNLPEQSTLKNARRKKRSRKKKKASSINNVNVSHEVIDSLESDTECIVPHGVHDSPENFGLPGENMKRTTDKIEGASIKVEIDPEDIIIAFHDEYRKSANYVDDAHSAADTDTTVSVCEDNCLEVHYQVVPEPPVAFTTKSNINWRRSETFTRKNVDGESVTVKEKLCHPIKFFEKYLPTFLFERIAAETNLQACETKRSDFELTSASEMKALFGLLIYMGSFNIKQVDAFWDLHSGLFSETMSLRRFMQLLNNVQTVPTGEPADCLHRARPVLDWISAGCVRLSVEENLFLSKQWVPFVSEPCVEEDEYFPGVNLYLLGGKSGFIYNFLVCQKGSGEIDVSKVEEFGSDAAASLSLLERIPKNGLHKLGFHNSFTSYNLLKACSERGVSAVGTISLESASELPFLSDEEMKSSAKYCDQLCSEDGEVVVVKWRAGDSIVFGSNFLGTGMIDEVITYDKMSKTFINVDKPEIAKVHEDCIYGADFIVYLLGLYKTYVLSTDAILRLILFAIDLAMINCWLEYKKEAVLICPQKKVINLQHFRVNVAMALANVSGSVPIVTRVRENVPVELRFDMIDHFPIYVGDDSPESCKMPGCGKKPFVQCTKCGVPLCFKRGRNCFRLFHMK